MKFNNRNTCNIANIIHLHPQKLIESKREFMTDDVVFEGETEYTVTTSPHGTYCTGLEEWAHLTIYVHNTQIRWCV